VTTSHMGKSHMILLVNGTHFSHDIKSILDWTVFTIHEKFRNFAVVASLN
jgi:hypothetical protein